MPGNLNYIEGQAFVGGNPLDPGATELQLPEGQSLRTQGGRVEMLLTPGVFLRLGDNSSLGMISSRLTNVTVRMERGRAIVEAAQVLPGNYLQVQENGATIRIL